LEVGVLGTGKTAVWWLSRPKTATTGGAVHLWIVGFNRESSLSQLSYIKKKLNSMFFYFYETFKIAFFSAIFQSSRTLTEAYSANTVGYQPGLSVDKLEE